MIGLSFSVGAISQAHGKVAAALETPVAEAAASLGSADALWMDETHYPREGIANWVWAAVQPLLAVLAIYPSGARYVIPDFIGDKCNATVTTDRYAGYAFIDTERRQICWAHLLRDLNRIGQRQGQAGRIGRRLLGLALVMFRRRDKGELSGAKLEGLKRRMRAALERRCAAAAMQPHGQHLRQPPQAVARAVDLHDEPEPGADQQCRRAGAAQHRARAQDLRADTLAAR